MPYQLGLGLNAQRKSFLFASYAGSLSIRDSVKCRRLIDSRWYKEYFGDSFELTTDQNQKQRFENNKTGYRIATSVDGALTGEGGDIIVIDDPHNVREAESSTVREGVLDWWDQAMQTRLNDPKTGAFIIIMQRVHENDLTGHILANENDEWDHLCLPARYEIGHPSPTKSSLGFTDPRTKEGEICCGQRGLTRNFTEFGKEFGVIRFSRSAATKTNAQRWWYSKSRMVGAMGKKLFTRDRICITIL